MASRSQRGTTVIGQHSVAYGIRRSTRSLTWMVWKPAGALSPSRPR
jgi:hypothetical protein